METITKSVGLWLKQRQKILVALNNLAGLLPHGIPKNAVSLTNFFQLLVDYTCAGHLQIFTLFIKKDDPNFKLTKNILKDINRTTNFIIQINYKFNKIHNISAHDITQLLEQFANRIELEDSLLRIQFNKIHKNYIN
jgi:regulator of sigma D